MPGSTCRIAKASKNIRNDKQNIKLTITIPDIIHRPAFCLKQRFGDWILSPFSGET
jgi:hypothetical protein